MFKRTICGLMGFIVILGLSLPVGGTNVKAEETIEVVETPVEELIVPVELSEAEEENLAELGFTEEEIQTMSLEEFNEYKNLDGELLASDDTYYQVLTNVNTNATYSIEVSEDLALDQINNPAKYSKLSRATNTQTSSWLQMTTTSSKLSNGNIQLKNSFKWLKSPAIALTDVVGISHSASAVKVTGTEGFAYKYTDGRGTHSVGSTHTTKNPYGIAKKFNLKAIGSNAAPTNHNGYISVQVKKGNKNDISANAFGNYTHVTLGVTGSIDIRTGNISVGGTLKKSEMENTMILFNY